MDRARQCLVELHVPFEIVYDRADAADFLHHERMIRYLVRDREPMAGRRFGIRAIRPELSQDPVVVASRHDIRGVGQARFWIELAALATVRSEAVISARSRTDVDHEAIGRVELGAPFENLLETPAILRIALPIDLGWFSRIVIQPIFVAIPLMDGQVIFDQREGCHCSPFGTQEGWHAERKGYARLTDEELEDQCLPAVGVENPGIPG